MITDRRWMYSPAISLVWAWHVGCSWAAFRPQDEHDWGSWSAAREPLVWS